MTSHKKPVQKVEDEENNLHPHVPTVEEQDALRKARRAELLAKRRQDEKEREDSRKGRVASAQQQQQPRAQQPQAQAAAANRDVLVLRSHPTAGKKIMATVKTALLMGGPMVGLGADHSALILVALRKALVAADEMYQHSVLLGWISFYVLASYIFPARHMYVILTLLNALYVVMSWAAWRFPRSGVQDTVPLLGRCVFPLRDLLHEDDRTKQSPVFQSVFLVYTGFVNWLVLAAVSGGGREGNVQSMWWLLQGACLCAGALGRFEALFAYVGVLGIFALLAMTGGFGLDLGILLLVIVVFVVWRLMQAHTVHMQQQQQRHQPHPQLASERIGMCLAAIKPKAGAMLASIGAWSGVGFVCTSAWSVATWQSLGATLSIQWCVGWVLIALSALEMFSGDAGAGMRNLHGRQGLMWAVSLVTLAFALWTQYAPALLIQMALVLKFVAIPHVVEKFCHAAAAEPRAPFPVAPPAPAEPAPRLTSLQIMAAEAAEAAEEEAKAAEKASCRIPARIPAVAAEADAEAKAEAEPEAKEAKVENEPEAEDGNDFIKMAMSMMGGGAGGAPPMVNAQMMQAMMGGAGGAGAPMVNAQMMQAMMPAAMQMMEQIMSAQAPPTAMRQRSTISIVEAEDLD